MKLLGLLRHVKSDWGNAKLADFDRALSDRGRDTAGRMGEEMRSLGIAYDAVLVSPARRTVETWKIIESNWHSAIVPEQEPRLYGASAELLVAIISEIDERVNQLLIVGHNPGLHHLALDLTQGDLSAQHERIAAKFPTGALAEIQLPITSWADFAGCRGHLARFLRPRDLEWT